MHRFFRVKLEINYFVFVFYLLIVYGAAFSHGTGYRLKCDAAILRSIQNK